MTENRIKTCKVILTGALKPGAKDSEEFKEYSKRSTANGEANGGVVLNRYVISENLGQGIKPNFVLIVEYPSREKAVAIFTNEEYESIIPLRDVAFDEVKILIVED